MVEFWQDIENYVGLYQVSNTGKVRTLNYLNSKRIVELKLKVNKQGKLEVGLSKNDKVKYKMVGRLVYETFNNVKLGRKELIMYKDGDFKNCSLDNLYTTSVSERQHIAYIENKRPLQKFEYYGEELTINDMTKLNGMSYDSTRNRLNRLKWNAYETIETPIHNNNARKERMRKCQDTVLITDTVQD